MGPALPLGDRAMARSCVGRVLRWSGVGLAGVGCAVGAGCAVSPGFRRSCQFWSTIAPFVLEHGQVVGRLVFERMAGPPETLYGAGIASNYQGQGLKLAKHFRDSKG